MATAALVSFPTPGIALRPDTPGSDSLQRFSVLVRANGPGAPTCTIELYENGSLVTELYSDTVTSTPEVITVAWDAADLADLTGADVQCRVSGVTDGTSDVEVGAVRWFATWDDYVSPASAGLGYSGKQPVARQNAGQTIALIDFPTPSLAPGGTQKFRVLVRASEVGFSPTVTIDLYENGSLVENLVDAQVISTGTSGEIIEATWSASSLADARGADVQCRVLGVADGPAAIEVGAADWQVALADTTPVNPLVGSVSLAGLDPTLQEGAAMPVSRPQCGTLSTQWTATELLWDAVTEDVDGDPITPDGYRVYYLETTTAASGMVEVSGTTHTLFLPAGDWYVWVTAYSGADESADSETLAFSTEAGLEPTTALTSGSSGAGLSLLFQLTTPIDDGIARPFPGALGLLGYAVGTVITARDIGWDELVAGLATFDGDGSKGGVTDDLFARPASGTLTFAGLQPDVANSLVKFPVQGAISIAGYGLSFAYGSHPAAGAAALTGRRPVLSTKLPSAQPEVGEATFSGLAPTLLKSISVSPSLKAGRAFFEVYQVHEGSGILVAQDAGIRVSTGLGVAVYLYAGAADIESNGWVCSPPTLKGWVFEDSPTENWVTQNTPDEDWNG